MRFFTQEEFSKMYQGTDLENYQIPAWQIEAVCEIIYSQIGARKRSEWNETTAPLPIKRASMEQMRFMLEHDIPFINIDKHIKSGEMEADLITDVSTLALRILGNNDYLYRGSPINENMGLNIPFGG